MKLTDAKVFYRTLSLVCFPLSIFLLIQRFLVLELDFFSLLTGFLFPIIGIIVAILFLKKDGYTTSASEIMFYLFILYCGVYFIFPSISLLTNSNLIEISFLIVLNFIILGLGWIGILYYIIF